MTEPQQSGNSSMPPRNAIGRGLLVLLVAVIVGVLVLNSLDNAPKKDTAAKAKVTTTTSTTIVQETTTTSVALCAPGDIKVLVANGTSTSGVALTATNSLKKARYSTIDPVKTTSTVPATAIYYSPGYQQEAVVLAAVLNLPPAVVQEMPAATQLPVASLGTAKVLVIIGGDQVASFAPGSSSSGNASSSSSSSSSTVATTSSSIG